MATALPRRSFLRGALGTCVGLPLLDAMLNEHGTAYAGGGAIDRHFFVGFHGGAIGGDGDAMGNLYAPDTIGPDYDLKTAIAPLGTLGIAGDVSVISGLRIPYGTAPIPDGGWAYDFHIQALGPLISGVKNNSSEDYGVNGPTADQIVAAALGGESLVYQVQASWYLNSGAPYGRDVLSYSGEIGAAIPVPGQASPQLAYQSLFTGFRPPDQDPGASEALLYELAKRRSVLDTIGDDLAKLTARVGGHDRQRLQRHLDEIRALEMKLQDPGVAGGDGCSLPADPGADPIIGGNNDVNGGDGFDTNRGYSDEHVRAQRFSDLIHMAFVCNLRPAAAMLYTMAQSHMNVFSFTGIPYDLHELGHGGGGTPDVSKVVAWHVEQFGYLVAKLRDTPEGTGTALDNCAMVLLHEAGHGFDPLSGNDNSTHSTENMCCLVAGRAGGLAAGTHIVANGLHPGNVLNTAMAAVGVDRNLGEVVGTVPELLA
jgi:Protein of unknown function (DUF1552)